MKKLYFLPLLVAMMFALANTATAETAGFTFKGQPLDFSVTNSATVDGTYFLSSSDTKKLLVMLGPDEKGNSVINVPEGKSLFTYSGDDYTDITFAIPNDMTINCSNAKMFQIAGRSGSNINVLFYKSLLSSVAGDVTLNLNHRSSETGYKRPLFDLSYVNVKFNQDDPSTKVNINFNNEADNGLIVYANKPSSVLFGYGDYSMVSRFEETDFNFFSEGGSGYLTVSGLPALDSYDGNSYYSEPFGAHIKGGTTLVDCDDNQIMGEVALHYMPSDYAYFDEEKNSDWRIVQACGGGVILQVMGAGDLSALDPDQLPWKPYAEWITRVEVSSNVMVPLTKLPQAAFRDFTNLQSVSLSGADDLEEIPMNCFSGCANLETLDFSYSENLKTVADSAFYGCAKLGAVAIPDGVEKIGAYAFYYCLMADITLPETFNAVGAHAFACCNSLRLPAGMGEVELIDTDLFNANVFYGTGASLYYEGTLDNWLKGGFEWVMMTSNNAGREHLFIDGDEVVDLVIPDGVTELKNAAFCACKNLKSVLFPESLTTVGDYAFFRSGLEDITLPDNITEVGEHAFAGCDKVTTLGLSSSLSVLGFDAFSGLAITELTVPEGVRIIDGYAFDGCDQLTELTLPKGLESVSSFAFFGCTSLQKVISYAWEPVAQENAWPVNDKQLVVWKTAQPNYQDNAAWADFFTFGEPMLDGYVSVDANDNELGTVTIEVKDEDKTGYQTPFAYSVIDGAAVKATATATENSKFVRWDNAKGETVSTDKEISLVTDFTTGNYELVAVFEANKCTVTATVIPEGAGVVTGQGEYDYGTIYTLTLEPAEGYELKEWRDGIALDEKSNVLSGLVIGDINIEVVLQPKSPTALDDLHSSDKPCTKLLRNDGLYILRNGILYTPSGQPVN